MNSKIEKRKKYVQSYICSVTFPETVESLTNMIRANKSVAPWITDMDLLLNFEANDVLYWTAPKWIAEGDIVFFYHTNRAKQRVRKLLVEVESNFPRKRKLIKLLERSRRAAELYGGKIFACAAVAGPVERFEGHKKHFVRPHFARLDDVCVFDSPLAQSRFADHVKIGRTTITPLFKREFAGIKKLLAGENRIPDYFQNAACGGDAFEGVTARNWGNISCSANAKFTHEAQLRTYWLDYFLRELKDKGTSLLEECECYRESKNTGRADYFIKIHNRWLPVEAKLDITDGKAALRQVTKYTNVDTFVPKKGICRDKAFSVDATPLCLLADRSGIYFVSSKNEFIDCGLGNPVLRREKLTGDGVHEIRNALVKFLNLSP